MHERVAMHAFERASSVERGLLIDPEQLCRLHQEERAEPLAAGLAEAEAAAGLEAAGAEAATEAGAADAGLAAAEGDAGALEAGAAVPPQPAISSVVRTSTGVRQVDNRRLPKLPTEFLLKHRAGPHYAVRAAKPQGCSFGLSGDVRLYPRATAGWPFVLSRRCCRPWRL